MLLHYAISEILPLVQELQAESQWPWPWNEFWYNSKKDSSAMTVLLISGNESHTCCMIWGGGPQNV